MDFLNFKKQSVLDHINEFLYNYEPYGVQTYTSNHPYKIYELDDHTISVNTSSSLELDIRSKLFYTTVLTYSYHKADRFECLCTSNFSYYKSKDVIQFKEFKLNGITYLRKSKKHIRCTDEYGRFESTPSEKGEVLSFETKFCESSVTNITIQERKEHGHVDRSVIFFRAKDPLDSGRTIMYDVDITNNNGHSTVIITLGYRNEIKFDIVADDASVLNLYNKECTFQSELTFSENEYKAFEFIKSTVLDKLESYKRLGGRMNIVNTMIENIKSMQ